MKPVPAAIQIMEATDPAQLDQVRSLLAEFAAEFEPVVAQIFEVQGFAAEVAGLPGRYAGPAGCLLLATVDSVAAGCVALRDLGNATSEMKRLYVPVASRGQGVARRLVAEILRRAAAIGYERMVLDTLLEMQGAIALYREFGFEDAAPYWDHPTEHAVFMARAL